MEKTPLVLIPGLIANNHMWRLQIKALRHVADCWVAPLPATDSLSAIAHDILLTAPDRFAVAGWSMGGYICFEMLKQQPSRISKLALLSTTAQPDSREMRLRRRLLVRNVRQMGLLRTTRTTIPRFLHPDRREDADLIDTLVKQAFEVGPHTFACHQTAMANRDDYTGMLPRISCPTLVVAGGADEVTPVHVHADMVARIPNARFEILDRAGHMVTFEQPRETARLLETWIAGNADALAA